MVFYGFLVSLRKSFLRLVLFWHILVVSNLLAAILFHFDHQGQGLKQRMVIDGQCPLLSSSNWKVGVDDTEMEMEKKNSPELQGLAAGEVESPVASSCFGPSSQKHPKPIIIEHYRISWNKL